MMIEPTTVSSCLPLCWIDDRLFAAVLDDDRLLLFRMIIETTTASMPFAAVSDDDRTHSMSMLFAAVSGRDRTHYGV
jgi:hypothetical protein